MSGSGVYTRGELKSGIAKFYDRSSGLWERVWGEHMHHGYYPEGQKKDHRVAQVDMIEAVLQWAKLRGPPASVLDVGCGIGGSSRHICRKFGSTGNGITLSPVQAERANQLSAEAGLGGKLQFDVADALEMPFDDASYELVWSMESGEHMPDKTKFVNELVRVTAPGGKIIIVTWCHRDLQPGETSLTEREQRLLRRINRAFYLPDWCSAADYRQLLQQQGVQNIQVADWTNDIKQFWPAVIVSALNLRSFWGLLRSGFTTLRGALVMPLMMRGYRRGIVKFALISGDKADNE